MLLLYKFLFCTTITLRFKLLSSMFASCLLCLLAILISGCSTPSRTAHKPRQIQPLSIEEKSQNPAKTAMLAFSPDGKYVIICGSTNGWLWDLKNAKVVCNAQPRIRPFYAGFTNDGIPYYGNYEKYTFWDKHSGETIKELNAPLRKTSNGTFMDPFMLSQDVSKEIVETHVNSGTVFLVRDLKTGNKYPKLPLESQVSLSDAKFSQNGKYLVFTSQDDHVVIMNTDTGTEINRIAFQPPDNCVYRLAPFVHLSSDGTRIALVVSTSDRPFSLINLQGGINIDTALVNTTVRIYATNSIKMIGELSLTGTVGRVVFAPNNQTFAVLNDGKAFIYNTKTLKLICTLTSNDEPVTGITFSRDNKYIATGDGVFTLKLWDAGTGKEMLSLEKPKYD